MALGKSKKDDRIATAQAWVEESGSGDFTVLDLPKGTNLWAPKEEKVYNVSIVAYDVTAEANKFVEKPAKPGQLYFQRSYYAHRGIGPEGAKRSYVCAAKTFGKKCAICEHLNSLSAPDNDADTIKMIKSMLPKIRQVWNVFVHEEPQKGVQLWDISFFLFGEYLKEKIKKADPDKRDKYMRFFDPNAGYDLRLAPSEKSMGQYKFLEFTDIEFKRRKEPLSSKIVKAAVDLDSVIKLTPYDKMKEILTGGGANDDEDADPDEDADDDDSVLEPSDTDDDDKDEDDDDEPKKKPAKKGKKKTKPEPEEDEDDDDAEPEDEEGDEGDDEEEDEDDSVLEPSDTDDDDDESAEEDSGDDDEDDGDEEAPLKKGDKVSFIRKGNRIVGKITSINPKNGVAAVKYPGRDTAIAVDIAKLTRAGEIKKAKRPPVLDDDDEDDDLPARPKKKVKKTGKKKRATTDDDDDIPF